MDTAYKNKKFKKNKYAVGPKQRQTLRNRKTLVLLKNIYGTINLLLESCKQIPIPDKYTFSRYQPVILKKQHSSSWHRDLIYSEFTATFTTNQCHADQNTKLPSLWQRHSFPSWECDGPRGPVSRMGLNHNRCVLTRCRLTETDMVLIAAQVSIFLKFLWKKAAVNVKERMCYETIWQIYEY